MELEPYQNDNQPGYPTFDEFKANRRRCIGKLAKVLGVIALSGTGFLSFGQKKKAQVHADTTQTNVQRKMGVALAPASKTDKRGNQCTIDTTAKDSTNKDPQRPTPPGAHSANIHPTIVPPDNKDREEIRPRGKMQPSDLNRWEKRH